MEYPAFINDGAIAVLQNALRTLVAKRNITRADDKETMDFLNTMIDQLNEGIKELQEAIKNNNN